MSKISISAQAPIACRYSAAPESKPHDALFRRSILHGEQLAKKNRFYIGAKVYMGVLTFSAVLFVFMLLAQPAFSQDEFDALQWDEVKGKVLIKQLDEITARVIKLKQSKPALDFVFYKNLDQN